MTNRNSVPSSLMDRNNGRGSIFLPLIMVCSFACRTFSGQLAVLVSVVVLTISPLRSTETEDFLLTVRSSLPSVETEALQPTMDVPRKPAAQRINKVDATFIECPFRDLP